MATPAAIEPRLLVATCIGCGARSRPGACAEGCDDVPLDLVDTAEIDAQRRRLEALEARVGAMREVAEAIAQGSLAWDELCRQARRALLTPLPAEPEAAVVVEAWGCPRCGRVDAPQPCIGVCIRRPVPMSDAGAYREVVQEAEALAEVERSLAALVGLAAHVTPRPGQLEATRAVLRERASMVLGADAVQRPR